MNATNHPGVGIGNFPGTTRNMPFKGAIDELALYNQALHGFQIVDIYQAGSLGKHLGPFLENHFVVHFTPTYGFFTNSVSVSLQGSVGFIPRRYTLDGSDPFSTWALYESPIRLTNHTTLKVQAFYNNAPASALFSTNYLRVYAVSDGLDNAWRKKYFGAGYRTDVRVSAQADPNGDGFTNLVEEYISGSKSH